jgi:hypothetical protein
MVTHASPWDFMSECTAIFPRGVGGVDSGRGTPGMPRMLEGNECGCQTQAPGGATPAKAEAQAQAQGQAARRRQGGVNTSWCCLRWSWWGRSGERGADDKRVASLERAEGGKSPWGGEGGLNKSQSLSCKTQELIKLLPTRWYTARDQPLVVGPINGSCSSLRMIAHAVLATIHPVKQRATPVNKEASRSVSKAHRARSSCLGEHRRRLHPFYSTCKV